MSASTPLPGNLTTAQLRGRLEAVVAAGEADGLHAVAAVVGGDVVLEHYGTGEDFAWGDPLGVVEFGPSTLHDLRSVTKSVTGLLYGIAFGEGAVPAPEEPLLQAFPQYPDLAADPRRAGLTVEHALTMTLGLEWREELPYTSPANAELAPDRYRYILERPVVEAPGTHWSYCGGASALLGGLIAAGTGRSLADYGREKLFEPLGIERFEWNGGDDGVPSAASGLRLTARDLAKIGELVVAGGAWEGRQVVPAEWVRTMLEPRHETDWGQRYGYQWYLDSAPGHEMVSAHGNGGQRLYVVPGWDLVVAVFAGNYDVADQWQTPAAVLEKVFLAD